MQSLDRWRGRTLLPCAASLLLLAVPAEASLMSPVRPKASPLTAVNPSFRNDSAAQPASRAIPSLEVLSKPPTISGNPTAVDPGLHHAHPPSVTTEKASAGAEATLRFSLTGAGIELFELISLPRPWSESSARITYVTGEPIECAPLSELAVKFHEPPADTVLGVDPLSPSEWLHWLDGLSDMTNDARYSPLVLGASGILGIWLARLKRPRPM